MASGFEVAGIILGALPLLISAWEHRHSDLGPVKVLLFKKQQMESLRRRLEENNMLFRQCCEVMLSMAQVKNIADLLRNSDGNKRRELWGSVSLEAQLLSTFGERDFNVIKSRLEEIHYLTMKLQEYLGKRPFYYTKYPTAVETRTLIVRMTVAGHFKKIVRSTSQAKDLDLLRSAIVELRTILDGESLSVVIGTAGTAWQAEIQRMKEASKHFLETYRCIEERWGCTCSPDHTISFSYRDFRNESSTVILAAASSAKQLTVPQIPWLLHSLKFTRESSRATAHSPVTTDICSSLRNGNGITLALSDGSHYKSSALAGVPVPGPTALHSLSGSLHDRSCRRLGTDRDRIAMGARLLLMVLQQHDTPWLTPTWTTADVLIPDASYPFRQLYFEALYYPSSQKTASNPQTTSASQLRPYKPIFARNAYLYNLSVALIEIALHNTIDNLITDEDRAPAPGDPRFARAAAAYRLSEELADSLIPLEYRNAVRFCLKGEFGVEIRGKKLTDDDLFDVVYRQAAKPLIELVHRNAY